MAWVRYRVPTVLGERSSVVQWFWRLSVLNKIIFTQLTINATAHARFPYATAHARFWNVYWNVVVFLQPLPIEGSGLYVLGMSIRTGYSPGPCVPNLTGSTNGRCHYIE